MDDPASRQVRFNAESRDQWPGFADHRRAVSALLIETGTPGRTRLGVLGAGNANDLDLPALLARHREVHLIDLDREALDLGAARQGVVDHPGLRRVGGLDLTGMLEAIGRWSPSGPIPPADLQALVDWPARRVGLAVPDRFDVVASTCLLSQIIGNVFRAVGPAHPQFLEAVRAIRLGHLRLLARLVEPGGTVVLINDVVSSDRLPTLAKAPDAALPALFRSLCGRPGLIHGMDPAEILALFREDSVLASAFGPAEFVPPWRWTLHRRTYLVWALKARRTKWVDAR